jgi:hypothetical protein
LKVTRVHIEHDGVVVCLATSASSERAWDGMHHLLLSRGKRTRSAAIDLLFVVADSRDPHWYQATAPLCREALLSVVHGVAYPELGAEQFAQGTTTYWTWMVRFFDVVITTVEQPGTVLRALLEYLSRGLVGTDFADLNAVLNRAGTCAVHRRTFAADTPIDGVRRLIKGDKDLARTLRSANRMVCVVRANPVSAERLDILDLIDSDQTMAVINVVCAHDADESDIVFLSSSEPWDELKRSDRAIPSADDLATLDSPFDCREATHRSRSASRGTGMAPSSSGLSPQLADFDPVDVPQLMVVGQFATGRSLLCSNPALGMILARWELCRRSHEQLLWWELQSKMKVSAETARVIGKALASGPISMLAAAAFPTDECLPDLLARIPVHLVRMQHLLGVRRIFLDDSAAAMHCRELLSDCPLEREDVLRLCLDIQLANFVSAELLHEIESAAIAPVRHHINAHELAREAAVRAGFKRPELNASGTSGRFRRLDDLFAFTEPGRMVARDEPLPERSEGFDRLADIDALLEEWGAMSNHCLGMFVLRDGWDDLHHAFYRVLEPVRATVHLMKVGSTWWLMDAMGQDGCDIDASLVPAIAAEFAEHLDDGSTHFGQT